MSTTAATPPMSFYGPTPEGFPPLARLSVQKYEAMVATGAFTESDRFELIEGALVEKMTRRERHATSSEKTRRVIERLLPDGWHARVEQPVRIPDRDSEPEPDLSVARGEPDDYLRHHPGPDDVALVVEVSDSTVAADRALAATYLGGGIPVYWLVNVRDRQLEIYTTDAGPDSPRIAAETETAELVIAGNEVARIAVASLLPRAEREG
jgi:Uma2 family endonuclease